MAWWWPAGHADNASLTSVSLHAAARRVRGLDWHVLGGLARPERWPDLRPGALDRVWAACRGAFDVTVVDIGFCLEDDEASATWAASPQRGRPHRAGCGRPRRGGRGRIAERRRPAGGPRLAHPVSPAARCRDARWCATGPAAAGASGSTRCGPAVCRRARAGRPGGRPGRWPPAGIVVARWARGPVDPGIRRSLVELGLLGLCQGGPEAAGRRGHALLRGSHGGRWACPVA